MLHLEAFLIKKINVSPEAVANTPKYGAMCTRYRILTVNVYD